MAFPWRSPCAHSPSPGHVGLQQVGDKLDGTLHGHQGRAAIRCSVLLNVGGSSASTAGHPTRTLTVGQNRLAACTAAVTVAAVPEGAFTKNSRAAVASGRQMSCTACAETPAAMKAASIGGEVGALMCRASWVQHRPSAPTSHAGRALHLPPSTKLTLKGLDEVGGGSASLSIEGCHAQRKCCGKQEMYDDHHCAPPSGPMERHHLTAGSLSTQLWPMLTLHIICACTAPLADRQHISRRAQNARLQKCWATDVFLLHGMHRGLAAPGAQEAQHCSDCTQVSSPVERVGQSGRTHSSSGANAAQGWEVGRLRSQ